MTSFTIRALDPTDLAALRATEGSDERVVLTAAGGEPVRCCLRDATCGEVVVLANHSPSMPASPYAERGAIFVHRDPLDCTEFSPHEYPSVWSSRSQVVRGYDARGWIVAAQISEPGAVSAAIREMLDDASVLFVHTRNPKHGCLMLRAERA